eukprot:13414843-Ditylum_brightwellii.AAC.1
MKGSVTLPTEAIYWTAQRCIYIHGGGCSACDAARANIKSDADEKLAMIKRHHFKLAATYLLPFFLVLRKYPTGTNCDAIDILDITTSGFGTKLSVGASRASL